MQALDGAIVGRAPGADLLHRDAQTGTEQLEAAGEGALRLTQEAHAPIDLDGAWATPLHKAAAQGVEDGVLGDDGGATTLGEDVGANGQPGGGGGHALQDEGFAQSVDRHGRPS